MRVRLAHLWSLDPGFVVLDEPTNHLDREGRRYVLDFVREFTGGLVAISHDRELLEHVEAILELSNQGLSLYGGSFSFYEAERRRERDLQSERLREAKGEESKRKREREEKIQRQQKRMRDAKQGAEKGGAPKILLGNLKRKSEESLGKIRNREEAFVETAHQRTTDSWSQMKVDPFLRFDFEAHRPHSGKVHFRANGINIQYADIARPLWKEPLHWVVQGAERWWIQGLNGSGKTSLLRKVLAESKSALGFLDQEYGNLDPDRSLLDQLQDATRFTVTELRNELAFFGFTGDQVHLPLSHLSGGEKLKASLALIFLGPTVPELLVLDEPTNNLDLASQALLSDALIRFEGALIIVSHDTGFVEGLNIDRSLELQV
jgi:ATPase subunit of ABC transporter with duplicated ATPase domains